MLRTALTLSAATLLVLAMPVAAQQTQKPAPQTQQVQKAQQEKGGVQTATQQLNFYSVQAADLRASDLIGMNVYNTNNESIGEIEDLILDNGKTLRAVIIDVGGFLGVGERTVALAPASVVIQKPTNGSTRAIVNATKDSLTKAPEFKRQAQAR